VLEAEGLNVLYGDYQILWDARFRAMEGEVVAILGPNGAGKSTLMNTLSGLVRSRTGRISFKGRRIDGLPPHRIVSLGLSHVLERRRLFPRLTVRQNLLLGAHNPEARAHRAEGLARVETLFPFLTTRSDQLAHTLSGGEQQMVAIARALSGNVKILLLDEPFEGLSPVMVDEVFRSLEQLRREISILVIEHHLDIVLSVADRAVVLDRGRVSHEGPAHPLLTDLEFRRRVLWL
jgi:branched-chain amino acid transport system ATP-binding protein/branched-chain amino acid transport system permease protein